MKDNSQIMKDEENINNKQEQWEWVARNVLIF